MKKADLLACIPTTFLQEQSDALLRSCFTAFIYQSFCTVDPAAHYLHNRHIDLLAEYLEACRLGQLQRLIINMPPRMMKSICVSVAWPAFLLGQDAGSKIVVASYSAALSVKHSIDCRLVVESEWYRRVFPHVALSEDQNQKQKFITTQRGHRIAASVGGTITGEGGNFLIVDDPLNPLQAESATTRHAANQWFEHTFATRLNDKKRGVMVVVMQRLHTQDLSGHLLAKGGWEHLCLPAVAPERMVMDFGKIRWERQVGELLHPEREDEALIARAKHELGSRVFAAQYQQAPLSAEGGMLRLRWFKRYQLLPENILRRVQSWDTGIKSGARNDASVCLTFFETAEGFYLVDAEAMRAEYPDLKHCFYAQAERWKPDAILLEDKASGQSLLQDIRRESTLPVIGIMPSGDKITRAATVSAMIEAGRVFLPQHAPWLGELETELAGFPGSTHDDHVDALSQFLQWVRKRHSSAPGMRRI